MIYLFCHARGCWTSLLSGPSEAPKVERVRYPKTSRGQGKRLTSSEKSCPALQNSARSASCISYNSQFIIKAFHTLSMTTKSWQAHYPPPPFQMADAGCRGAGAGISDGGGGREGGSKLDLENTFLNTTA